MMHYRDWTATQVRDWLIEAARTVRCMPRANGPRQFGNAMPEVVREAWKDAAPSTTASHPVASSHAIARMEAVWTWVNDLPREEERRLMYEWAEAKALGKGYLARVMERNELTERTLRNVVLRVCQRIADGLNRKHEIRLTMTVDAVSEISDPVSDFSVQSKYCATPARSPKFVREDGHLTCDDSEEGKAAVGKYLAAVNRRRQNQARRKADREAKKRQKQAA